MLETIPFKTNPDNKFDGNKCALISKAQLVTLGKIRLFCAKKKLKFEKKNLYHLVYKVEEL